VGAFKFEDFSTEVFPAGYNKMTFIGKYHGNLWIKLFMITPTELVNINT